MIRPVRNVYCGHAAVRAPNDGALLIPWDRGEKHLRFNPRGFGGVVGAPLNERWKDFLTIAAFVYAADGGLRRGDRRDLNLDGRSWARKAMLHIPVSDLKFWSSDETKRSLSNAVGWITGDEFTFQFLASERVHSEQMPLFGTGAPGPNTVVVLASGGMDSTTRVAELLSEPTKRVIAVGLNTHSVPHARREAVLRAAARQAGERFVDAELSCLKHNLDVERTLRSRPLLLAALGGATSTVVGSDVFEMPENGFTALNIALHESTKDAMASRTAHPKTLWLLEQLIALVGDGRRIRIVNPYSDLTRRQVVETLGAKGRLDLLPLTVSCSTGVKNGKETHCGRCTQCVDRRIAVSAAGYAEYDVAKGYHVDPLFGNGSPPSEATVLEGYCRAAPRWAKLRNGDDLMLGERGITDAGAYEARRLQEDIDVIHDRWAAVYRRVGEDFLQVEQDLFSAHRRTGAGPANSDSLLAFAGRALCEPIDDLPEGPPVAVVFEWRTGSWHHRRASTQQVTEARLVTSRTLPVLDATGPTLSLWIDGKEIKELEGTRGGLSTHLSARLHARNGASAGKVVDFLPDRSSPESVGKAHYAIRATLDRLLAGLSNGFAFSGASGERRYRFEPGQPLVVLAKPPIE